MNDDMDSSQQNSPNQELPPPVEIPLEALAPETLQSLIESFIMREGTDYGWNEVEMETKVGQIQTQLKSGKVRIVFDPGTESVTLLTEREWKKIKR